MGVGFAMLLNHARKTPRDWDDAEASLCPDCGSRLLARRGPVLAWHWAHKGTAGNNSAALGCHTSETFWHLRWKEAYHSFSGWEIEVPIECDGCQYRADAMNERTGRVR